MAAHASAPALDSIHLPLNRSSRTCHVGFVLSVPRSTQQHNRQTVHPCASRPGPEVRLATSGDSGVGNLAWTRKHGSQSDSERARREQRASRKNASLATSGDSGDAEKREPRDLRRLGSRGKTRASHRAARVDCRPARYDPTSRPAPSGRRAASSQTSLRRRR
jgi:hypothetical protein